MSQRRPGRRFRLRILQKCRSWDRRRPAPARAGRCGTLHVWCPVLEECSQLLASRDVYSDLELISCLRRAGSHPLAWPEDAVVGLPGTRALCRFNPTGTHHDVGFSPGAGKRVCVCEVQGVGDTMMSMGPFPGDPQSARRAPCRQC